MIAMFMTAIPVAVITGSCASGFILNMDGIRGLAGWQWLFVIEALTAIILGIVVYFLLTDRPEHAHWLTEPQRQWLCTQLAAERAQRESIRHYALGETLRNPRVWALTLIYFGQNVTGYGFVLFLPQIVKQFGLTNVQTGLVSSLPFIGTLIGIFMWARAADRTGARSTLCGASLLSSAALLILCLALQSSPVATMAALILFQIAASGIAADLLGAALRHADWQRRSGRHRADQRGGQSRGISRPLRHGPRQGRHRQLPNRSGYHRDGFGDRRNHRAGDRP